MEYAAAPLRPTWLSLAHQSLCCTRAKAQAQAQAQAQTQARVEFSAPVVSGGGEAEYDRMWTERIVRGKGRHGSNIRRI